jgi:hypothetical protein
MSNGNNRLVKQVEPPTDQLGGTHFSDYLDTDYIILLGDPGSGKTYTFETEAKNTSSCLMSVRQFLASKKNNFAKKTLFLDGLDEYRSRSDDKNLVLEVIQKLNRLGVSRLRLTEDICRDRLLDLIRPTLSPIDLRAEPEGHMAKDTRADIVIYSSPGQKLPLELKRDYHPDLWKACANQLDRLYTRDPEASGHGIYVVFWFGNKRSKKIPTPPKGISLPTTPKKLETALSTLLSPADKSRLEVVVIDTTPPSSPQESFHKTSRQSKKKRRPMT